MSGVSTISRSYMLIIFVRFAYDICELFDWWTNVFASSCKYCFHLILSFGPWTQVAVYAEFRRDWAEALRFYEEAYRALREVLNPLQLYFMVLYKVSCRSYGSAISVQGSGQCGAEIIASILFFNCRRWISGLSFGQRSSQQNESTSIYMYNVLLHFLDLFWAYHVPVHMHKYAMYNRRGYKWCTTIACHYVLGHGLHQLKFLNTGLM